RAGSAATRWPSAATPRRRGSRASPSSGSPSTSISSPACSPPWPAWSPRRAPTVSRRATPASPASSTSSARWSSAEPASTGAGPRGPKVALLLSTLQEERYQKDKRYFEEEARRLGLSPFTLAADNDNARQLSQVEDALSRGAKVLVIQPTDSAAAAAYVAKAH